MVAVILLDAEIRLSFVYLRDELTSKLSEQFLDFNSLALNAAYLKQSCLSDETGKN